MFSYSQSIPMDRITYDIMNDAAERRRREEAWRGVHPNDLVFDYVPRVYLTYDEDLQVAHFISDEELFSLEQTPNVFLLTFKFYRRYPRVLIDKRTGESHFQPSPSELYEPEIYISLIRVYGQTQRAFILELIKSYLMHIYCRHEREEKSKQPLIKIIDDALNPYYDASSWLKPEQGRIFKEFINA